jgi:hypothetical protein
MHIVFPRFAGVPHLSYFPANKTLEFEGLEMLVARVVDPHTFIEQRNDYRSTISLRG